jgi:hypothetical protein
LILLLAGCESFFAPHSPDENRRTVEGCEEAVAHLKSCCPKYETWTSCTYFTDVGNASGRNDLTKGESRCLREKKCDELARDVPAGSWICGTHLAGRHCR